MFTVQEHLKGVVKVWETILTLDKSLWKRHFEE